MYSEMRTVVIFNLVPVPVLKIFNISVLVSVRVFKKFSIKFVPTKKRRQVTLRTHHRMVTGERKR